MAAHTVNKVPTAPTCVDEKTINRIKRIAQQNVKIRISGNKRP